MVRQNKSSPTAAAPLSKIGVFSNQADPHARPCLEVFITHPLFFFSGVAL